ncbi:hypothetical protein [Sphingobium aquiterrae]|uniref:hypothetical protein n=1 Tax=Sphingobium aquiterrae TaxID=2038656 RepID=UPI003015C1C4
MTSNRSREDFFRFLDWLNDKGMIAPGTAASRRASANQVLAILDETESHDVTIVDLDQLMLRFHNLNRDKYTTESLQTYKSRIKSALDDFRVYVENPLGFKPSIQQRTRTKKAVEATQNRPQVPPLEKSPALEPHYPTTPPPGISVLPIPLRADLTIQIAGLPFDLSQQEARKIANIILAHAIAE